MIIAFILECSISHVFFSEIIVLSSNKLSGRLPLFKAGTGLRGVYLSDNRLHGRINESICALIDIESLFLDDNKLSGGIPKCLSQLTSLEQLYLFGNSLTGEVPQELSALRQLSKFF